MGHEILGEVVDVLSRRVSALHDRLAALKESADVTASTLMRLLRGLEQLYQLHECARRDSGAYYHDECGVCRLHEEMTRG
jgi:hypothetical protein